MSNLELLTRASGKIARDGASPSSAAADIDSAARVLLTDLLMPYLQSGKVLEKILRSDHARELIFITLGSPDDAAAGCAGQTQSLSLAKLRERVAQLVDAAGKQHAAQPDEERPASVDFKGMVGGSALMRDLFARIRRVAPHFRIGLITGATGSGKDLAAQAIHGLSPVASGRFVALNCSAVTEALFESQFFGHAKGSFTGAIHEQMGFFEYAHGGTLFLDEIGDMPLASQAKLLRILQHQEVQRVGSLSTRKVDVRVIAATNQNLRKAVAERRFREDLYYRLTMLEISVPSLAERKEDLPRLARHFIARFAAQYRKEIRSLTHRAQARLADHDWPGNVRELENVLGHACLMAEGAAIDVHDFPANFRSRDAGDTPAGDIAPAPDAGNLASHERLLIIRALQTAGGSRAEAARILQIGRDALRYKLKKYNLIDDAAGSLAPRVRSASG